MKLLKVCIAISILFMNSQSFALELSDSLKNNEINLKRTIEQKLTEMENNGSKDSVEKESHNSISKKPVKVVICSNDISSRICDEVLLEYSDINKKWNNFLDKISLQKETHWIEEY